MTPTTSSGRMLAAALPAVTVVTALVVAAGALAGVIALLWASVQALTGESPITLEEALTLGAPSAEEEQKRSVLRALKDLEFERGVGKISEDDYAELSARYRAEAKRLMQILDEDAEPDRQRAEKALRERLAQAPSTPLAADEEHVDGKESPETTSEPAASAKAPDKDPDEPASTAPSATESEEAS